MAYVVERRDPRPEGPTSSRYEIRESVMTSAGPRARTLVTFRVLTAAVIADAAARAERRFDAEKIRARAADLRIPRHSHEAAATASALLARIRRGDTLPPVLVAELRRALPQSASDAAEVPDELGSAVEWIGVDDATRGRALRDLVDVASRIPAPTRTRALSFPRMSSTGSS